MIFNKLLKWVKNIFNFNIDDETINDNEEYVREYEDISKLNFNAIFSKNLGNKVVTESKYNLLGLDGKPNLRTEFIKKSIDKVWGNSLKITVQAFGKGGKVLIPYIYNNKGLIDVIDQSRLFINKQVGDEIIDATIIADSLKTDINTYYRLTRYYLENGNQIIENKVIDENGKLYPIQNIDIWANIAEQIIIQNVDKLLIAFLKSPIDNRLDKDVYGVPLTYGCEIIIQDIYKQMTLIDTEYDLKRPMLGLDSRMWQDMDSKKTVQDQNRPFMPIFNDENKPLWMLYDPAIRDAAMFNKLEKLFELLEKSIGTSRGILTLPQTVNATATEIKSANYDTFVIISNMRKNWEKVIDRLAYSFDVLAEFYGVTPAGARNNYILSFDWDFSLYESSTETFMQLSELQSRGGISLARLVQYVTNEPIEDIQEEIDKIKETAPTITQLIG